MTKKVMSKINNLQDLQGDYPKVEISDFKGIRNSTILIIPQKNKSETLIFDKTFTTPIIVKANISDIFQINNHHLITNIVVNSVILDAWKINHLKNLNPFVTSSLIFLPFSSHNRKYSSWFNLACLKDLQGVKNNSRKTILTFFGGKLANFHNFMVYINCNHLQLIDRIDQSLLIHNNALKKIDYELLNRIELPKYKLYKQINKLVTTSDLIYRQKTYPHIPDYNLYFLIVLLAKNSLGQRITNHFETMQADFLLMFEDIILFFATPTTKTPQSKEIQKLFNDLYRLQ